MKYFVFPKINSDAIGRFSFGGQPLTLLILHNIFKDFGHEDIRFIDENIKNDWFSISHINESDYIFISINLFNQDRAIDIISQINKVNAKVVIGGPILELSNGNLEKIGLKKTKNITCITGGWLKIAEYLEYCHNIALTNTTWDNITKYQSDRISKKLIDEYTIKHKEHSGLIYSGNYTNIHSKLGCHYRLKTGGCNFCSRHFEKFDSTCPTSLIALLKKLHSKYNVNFFWDSSDTFFNTNHDLEEYCKAGLPELPIELLIFSRLNNINDKTAYLLKKCNVRSVIVGVESGSNRILRIAKKNLTVNQIYRSIDLLNKYEISVIPCLTIGHPSETIFEIEKTNNLAHNLANNYLIDGFSCSPIMPIPGSFYFSNFFNDIPILTLSTLTKLQGLYFSKHVGIDLLTAKKICHETETIIRSKAVGIWGKETNAFHKI
jgi:hypothetical protein